MNELRVGKVLEIAGVTIIPVEAITIHREINVNVHWWYGSKAPYALVIRTSTGLQVIDCNAQELNIRDLISELPQLTEILRL